MEQIQIRQPKMPVAQSFIQKLGTFLAILIKFTDTHSSYKKNNLCIFKTIKPIGNTGFLFQKYNFTYQKKKSVMVIKLRI